MERKRSASFYFSFWLLSTGVSSVFAADTFQCPTSGYPSDPVPISVWTKASKNGANVYRVGGEELLAKGYQRSSHDDLSVILALSGSPFPDCPAGTCLSRITTAQRIDDGGILHQLTVGDPPRGYSTVDESGSLYCGRNKGDCGADAPIFIFISNSSDSAPAVYSIDPNASFDGMRRETRPLCYAWRDRGASPKGDSAGVEGQSDGCPPIPDISDGQVTYKSTHNVSFPLGSSASVRCKEGFVIAGPATITCTHFGWYPRSALGRCVLRNRTQLISEQAPRKKVGTNYCGSIAEPANGRIIYDVQSSGLYPAGTTAILRCDPGFTATSAATEALCENGLWSTLSVGPCERSTSKCTQLLSVPNGQIEYTTDRNGQLSVGTRARVRCTDGYELVGAETVVCAVNGWAPAEGLGNCQPGSAQCIFGMPPVLNGRISYSQTGTLSHFPSGTTAQLECNNGFVANGVQSATCNGQLWVPASFGTCVRDSNGGTGGSQCPFGLSASIGGTISYSQGSPFGPFPSGTVASLQCPSGSVQGATTSQCLEGQWIPNALGACGNGGGTSCATGIPPVFNGHITYSNGGLFGPFPPGTTARLTCNLGHSPSASGSTSSTCENGSWTPSPLAQCIAGGPNDGQCPTPLAVPANGQITYSNGRTIGPYDANTIATLTCSPGFSPSGPSTFTCRNRAWDPPSLPQCVQGGGQGQCTVGLFTPLNARLEYSNGVTTPPYPSGTSVTMVCNPGFTPSGTQMATCVNGQFSPSSLGQCIQNGGGGTEGHCLVLMSPFNGQISYSQQGSASTYPSGTIATLMCNLGYTVSGGATATTCINGQWNPSTLGTCQVGIGGGNTRPPSLQQCPFALPNVPNGNIQYPTGSSVGPFNNGDVAVLVCNVGSIPPPTVTSLCSNGVWQPNRLGPCTGNGINEFGIASGQQCPPLPPILGGHLIYSEENASAWNRQGSMVSLACDPGFTILGPSTAVCTNGIWNPWPGVGSCQPQQPTVAPLAVPFTANVLTYCPALIPPSNANIDYNQVPTLNSYPAGSIAKLQCNLGFTADGASLSTCRNGAFTPPLGACQQGVGSFSGPGTCVSLPAPKNGKMFYIQAGTRSTNERGTTAILTCDAGFVVNGQTTFTCTDSGWMPKTEMGFCQSGNQLH